MQDIKKQTNTKQVAVPEEDYSLVLDHALKYYGHIGKFFGRAAVEKMESDKKKEKMLLDTGND